MIAVSENFSFLEKHDKKLVEIASLAEHVLYINTNTCLIILRQFAELLAEKVASQIRLKFEGNGEEGRFYSLLKGIYKNKLFKYASRDTYRESILRKFHIVRIQGNKAIHPPFFTPPEEEAFKTIQTAWELGVWYDQSFGYSSISSPSRYTKSLNPFGQTERQIEQLNAEIKNINEQIKKKCKENQQLDQSQQQTEAMYRRLLEEKQNLLDKLEEEKQAEIEATRKNADSKYQDALAEVKKLQEKLDQNKLSEEKINKKIKRARESEKNISKFVGMLMGDFEDDETIEGYDNVSQKLNLLTNTLGEISVLIGDNRDEEITLNIGHKLKPGIGLTSQARLLNQKALDLKHGIFNVLVLGTFSNGKSTLLNAMLGVKKLPTNNLPATAIITMLVYGQSEQVKLYFNNGQEAESLSFQEFKRKYILGIEDQETLNDVHFIDRFKHIEFAEVECDYNLCKGGVRLIDSPGIGEQRIRTKLTTEFFPQSHAVIMVLNATQILTQDERKFINENLAHGNNENLFFVVNQVDRINYDDDDDPKQELINHIQNYLKHVYMDGQGDFDQDLFNHRVFLLSSKLAFDARKQESIQESLLEHSGILEFEKELENFLTTGAKFRSAISSIIDILVLSIEKMEQKIIQQEKLLYEPLSELEKRRATAEHKLKELEGREDEIRDIIKLYSKNIIDKLCNNLDNFIFSMKNNWEFDYKKFTDLDNLNFINLLSMMVDDLSKSATTKSINNGLMKYLEHKFEEWSDTIPLLIQLELESLQKQLNTSIRDFAREISLIESNFVGENMIDIVENRANTIVQLIISAVLGNFGTMSTSLMGENDWSSFFWETIKQTVLVTTILTIFTGPVEWIALILGEIVQFKMKDTKAKKELIKKVGKKLFENVDEQLPGMKQRISAKAQEEFDQLSTQICCAIQEKIAEVRNEQNRIIQERSKEEFSIDQEKQRINLIQEEVVLLFNKITKATYNKEYSLEEIKWLYHGKQLLTKQGL